MPVRIALISDIHGNLPALEAVLAHARGKAPDIVFSLGDQVGFGPCQREVVLRLTAEGINCLRGNHEQRLVDLRDGQRFDTPNFAALHWGNAQLSGLDMALPMTHRFPAEQGGLFLTHAAPSDTYGKVHPDHPEPMDAALTEAGVPVMAVGHRHQGFARLVGGRLVVVAGSVGAAENGIAGTALYTMATFAHGGWTFEPMLVPYDVTPLYAQFLTSGLAAADPVFARLTHTSMRTNMELFFPFMAYVQRLLHARALSEINQAVWTEAGNTFEWPDGAGDCRAYWGL